jgi:hypothetical protein
MNVTKANPSFEGFVILHLTNKPEKKAGLKIPKTGAIYLHPIIKKWKVF